MPFLLYLLTALALLWLALRFVSPFSRYAALALLLLPLCFTGRTIFTGRVYGPIDLPYQMHNAALSDVAWQMIPWRAAVRDAFAHHEWPLWDRFTLGSLVILAAMGIEHCSHRGLAIACTVVLIVTAAASALIPHAGSEYRVAADLLPLGVAALLFALRVPVRVAVPALLGLGSGAAAGGVA